MKRYIWIVLLTILAVVFGYQLARNVNQHLSPGTITQDSTVEIKEVLKHDTLRLIAYVELKDSLKLIADSVKSLPVTEQVEYFALRTGPDSLSMNIDSTVNVKLSNIMKANLLFVESDAYKARVEFLENQIIPVKDSAIKILSSQYESAVQAQVIDRAEINRLARKIKLTKITYSAAALLLILLVR